jgi:ABC-type transport system involved in cytochrome bd biosynthesis fused ATPase/permease subunit
MSAQTGHGRILVLTGGTSSPTTVCSRRIDSESVWSRLGVGNLPCDSPEVADEHSGNDRMEGLYASGWPGIRWSVAVLSLRAVLLAGAAVWIGEIVDHTASSEAIVPLVWWLATFVACAAVLGWTWPRLSARTGSRVETSLRSRILEMVFRHPSDRYRTGEVAHRATEGATAVGSMAGRFLPQLIGGVVIPLLICVVVATIDVASALVLLVAVPSVPLLLRGLEKRFTSVTDRYRETADRLAAEFFDGIQGMGTLRAMGYTDRYAAGLERDSERLRGETMALLRVNQLALLVVDSVFTLGTVVAAGGAAIWRAGQGAISAGEAVTIVLLGVALIEPISQIGRFFYVGAIGRAAAKDIRGFLDGQSSGDGFTPRIGDEGWVELEHVSFAYREGAPVLDDVSLRVEAGDIIGLVGASGAGKTTLARLIAGLLQPDEGRLAVGGKVGLVSQQPFLFHGTLRENLLLAAPHAREHDLRAALDAADLGEMAAGKGLDRQVGELGTRLSGGEQQRLTIARMLLADAPIVVLDEPTSNVDIETEGRIRSALSRLTAHRTVIVIAHRRSTLAGVDRVISVGGGTITETMGVSS